MQVRVLPSPLFGTYNNKFAFSLLVRTVVSGTIRDGSIPSMHNKQCQFYKAVVQWLGHRLIHIQYLMILTILYYILVKLGTYNRSSILLCLTSATYNTITSQVRVLYYLPEWIISIMVNAIHFNVSIKQLFLENIYSLYINFNKQNYGNKQKPDVYHQ